MKYAVNGRFLAQKVTGVQRYAREILLELDKIVSPNEICIVCAKDATDIPEYKNISIVFLGKKSSMRWFQFTFPKYCKKNKLISLNLCGSAPFIDPGIVCMHDLGFFHYPKFVTKKFYLWAKLQTKNSIKKAKGIISVSEFSKNDIKRWFPKMKQQISVIPNAWQHTQRIGLNNDILDKYSLTKGEYFYSLSSIAPNKNLLWIVNTAINNPEYMFVISGGINNRNFAKSSISIPDNVKLTGYVSDEETKALMSNCRAFVFPSFFEGFGIPPLEAIANGAPEIIISDTECMHEIYGDCAHYIDPNIPQKNISSLLDNNFVIIIHIN